jgi:NAD+ synthase (glutamine-hydrolysing)
MSDEKINLTANDFIRVAAVRLDLKIGDIETNRNSVLQICSRLSEEGVQIIVFPEQTLTGYSIDDLYHQRALYEQVENAAQKITEASKKFNSIVIFGVPIKSDGILFNGAIVVYGGRIYGCNLKKYLPNNGEFYEQRYFASSDVILTEKINYAGHTNVPVGDNLNFQLYGESRARFSVEICEDLWAPIPPSTFAALSGTQIIFNLSASNSTIGKSAYRRALVNNQAARLNASYVYCSSGAGESTTDLCWDGHLIISENGSIRAEVLNYEHETCEIIADIDLERLDSERLRNSSLKKSREIFKLNIKDQRTVEISIKKSINTINLYRKIDTHPYIGHNDRDINEKATEIIKMQAQGLVQRLKSINVEKVVIGISGGLDSTLALIVCCEAFDRMSLPRSGILAYTMPGYATSDRTLKQALELIEILGCTGKEINIIPSCNQMFSDIGHVYASGETNYDITFENVQAGERTNHLFRLANLNNCPVIGTGDLSELALGWCTYGVGDHMSHYNVNASVPKTLVKHIISIISNSQNTSNRFKEVLLDILDTEISPELVPSNSLNPKNQLTEEAIGPYDLHDFFLFYTLRYGFSPKKIKLLCYLAWQQAGGKYDVDQINKCYEIFRKKFFLSSQYKRSVAVNAPKIGNGGSLSPRSDWRAPSDSLWLP